MAEKYINEWDLTSPIVDFKHLDLLVQYQEQHCLKIAPKLTQDVLHPRHFEKMNVRGAMAVFSKTTSSALEHLVENCGFPRDFCTTAKFIESMQKWYSLINSRCPSMALSLNNEDAFQDAVQFIKMMANLFATLKTDDNKWKPYQTALVAASTSIIELANDLLKNENFGFFLTSRVSQDSLENTFCAVRSKNPVPTAREFKYNLRAICCAQYLKEKKSTSYEFDDTNYLVNCLGDIVKNPERNGDDDELEEFARIFAPNSDNDDNVDLIVSEGASLYYLAGYVIRSVMQTNRTCENCVGIFISGDEDSNFPEQELQKLRAFKQSALVECSKIAYDKLFVQAENLIRSFPRDQLLSSKSVTKKLVAMFQQHKQTAFNLTCHDTEAAILKKFFRTRLHFIAREEKEGQKSKAKRGSERASKSTEMRHLVKKV